MRTHLVLSLTALAVLSGDALAQKPNLGAYVGTATITTTEASGKTRRQSQATVRITVPVTSTGSSTMAEVDDVDKPSATATITELTLSREETSRGADGKFAKISCKLSKPAEIPMNASGNISIDSRAKTYTIYIAFAALKQVTVDCVHSQSGAHKRQDGAALAIATHDPSGVPKGLPYTDPAKLVAKHKLVLGDTTLEQSWDFQLKR